MATRYRLSGLLGMVLLAPGCAGLPDLFGDREPAGLAAAIAQPTVGYRADQVTVVDGNRFTGRVYAMPGVRRLELPTEDQAIVSVVDYGAGTALTWVEGTDSVSRTLGGHVGVDLRSPNYTAFELEPLGPDTVDGLATERFGYRATVTGGGTHEGEFWLTPENIIVRIEGTLAQPELDEPQQIEMRLENLELGPQDPALFEAPPPASP